MKKEVNSDMDDDLRPEYDFSQLAGGVRGKYVERYRAGTNLVLLDQSCSSGISQRRCGE